VTAGLGCLALGPGHGFHRKVHLIHAFRTAQNRDLEHPYSRSSGACSAYKPDHFPAARPGRVDGATAMPSFTSSPWIRRWPHSGFSRARRSTSRPIPEIVAGRPGPPPVRVVLPRHKPAVPGQQRRGCDREHLGPAPARHYPCQRGEQARSAGSYRTRPACRCSTAFSCRSTSTSAATAWSPRASTTIRPSIRRSRQIRTCAGTDALGGQFTLRSDSLPARGADR
jgi:hypothetical protein